MTTTVFARDDDLGKPFASLPRFHRLFVERDIPIAYQVVPSFLGEETAAEALELHAASPDLVELHQHGTTHEQTIDGRHAWTEFAGSRPEPEQRRILAEGRDRLEGLLGGAFDPTVFTPPGHKYGPATVRVLAGMGVTTLSAGVRVDPTARIAYTVGHALRRVRLGDRTISYHARHLPASQITEWSCAVNIDMDGDGERVSRSADELRAEFARVRESLDTVGLMLHHECYESDAKFAALESFLDTLSADPTVSFASLGSLAGA